MTRLTGLFLMQISIADRFEFVDTAELRCGIGRRWGHQANSNTTVHVVWDTTHHANIVLAGVLLNTFVQNQDYHLI
jgi:hypothetical protein